MNDYVCEEYTIYMCVCVCVCVCVYIYIVLYIILYNMCVTCGIIVQTYHKIMGYSSLYTPGFNLFYKGDCV